MKRKRGKKGKSKKAETTEDVNNLSGDDESSPDDPPPVTLTPVIEKPVGRLVYNRVKVKIKSSKSLVQPQVTSSLTHSQLLVPEKQIVTDDSVPEETNSLNQPKKAGTIKIKSSKGFGLTLSPCSHERTHPKEPDPPASRPPQTETDTTHPKDPDPVSQTETHPKEPQPASQHHQAERTHPKEPGPVSQHPQAERTYPKEPEPVSRNPQAERTHSKEPDPVFRHPQAEGTYPKEPEPVSRESVYNKQELIASLEVIKKIMKMEASEPFNVPVNPIALGIPDYFDVIKTPMDFGTICSNLESGVKYMNSVDVYKDVQYIWENCYKYNSKGDYIMELMKRVKKNFSKYWSAAGLYSEQQQGDMKDGNISSHGKSSSKSGNLKNKSRKRHGFKRHKDDCLCAICIMVRRRQEREHVMNPADDQTETSEGLVQEVKPEGTSAMGTPNGDDTSSSTDNSQNEYADAEMDDKGVEVKLEKQVQSTLQSKQQEEKEKETPTATNKENAVIEQSQVDSKAGTEKDRIRDIQMADAGDSTQDDMINEEKITQRKDETAVAERPKPKELMDAGAKAKLYKNLHQRYDNPMVLELCASLFPQNPKSLWSRHHSLVNRHSSSGNSSIDAAIATFIKY